MKHSIALSLLVLFVGCTNPVQKEAASYRVKIATSPNGSGIINPSADSLYNRGESISLTAIPAGGFIFKGWSGDIISIDNPHRLIVEKDYLIRASFEKRSYPLVVETVGEGTVSEKVVETKSKDYEHGTVVQLTATPQKGYRFIRWEGDVASEENPVQLTIDEPKQVKAIFEKKSYSLTVHVEGSGSVKEEIVSKAKDYEHGTVVELTARPGEGFKFMRWQGDVTGTENPVRITIDESKEVTAVFEEQNYDLDINVIGQGSVSRDVVKSKGDPYRAGSLVRLTAQPAGGWIFVKWQGDIPQHKRTNNPVDVRVDADKRVTAVFGRRLEGIVSGKQTLWSEESPYYLTGAVRIANRSTLELGAGVTIYGRGQDNEDNTIEVSGELKIKGADDSPVMLYNVIIKGGESDGVDWSDEEDDDDRDDDDRRAFYGIDMERAVMLGGELLPPSNTEAFGSIEIKHSMFYKVNRSSDHSEYMYLRYPTGESKIEQNIFYNSGRIVIRAYRTEVEIVNNYFHRDEFLSNALGYAIEVQGGFWRSEVEIHDNTFANTEGVAMSLSPGSSFVRLEADKNFWSTTSRDVIERMIYDGRDNRSINEHVDYDPFRRAPHGRTPSLPDSLR